MNSSKILAVAWREFRQTVLRPIFIIAILGIPILIIGIGVVAGVIFATHEDPPLIGTVVIVESTGEVAEAALIEMDDEAIRADEQAALHSAAEAIRDGGMDFGVGGGNISLQRGEVRITIVAERDTGDAKLTELKRQLQLGELLAVAVIPPNAVDMPPTDSSDSESPDTIPESPATYDLYIADGIVSDSVHLIEERLGKAVVRVRAVHADLPLERARALLTPPRPSTRSMTETGVEQDRGKADEVKRQLLPMVFMMLIWIGVFSSAQHLMLSTIEEKSNRVMEVLLSALSPFQLMAGKILGYGAVGLLIVGIYASLGIAALVVLATFSDWLSWVDLAMLAIFYLMAYFMIASMMAAVGSAVTDIREANTLITPVMLIIMVPLMLWMPISKAPNGAIATVFSFIPPATPFAMMLRHAAEEPVPLWQYPATILWGFLCTLAMIWLAGKIFRVGVLMYGKPPSPIELLKWVRYS